MSGQLKSKLRDVTQGLSGKAGQLKGEVSDRAAGARQAVAENGKTVLGAGEPVTKTIAGRAPRPAPQARPPGRGDRLGRHPGAGPAAGQAGRGHREPAPGAGRGGRGRGRAAAAGWLVFRGGRR